MNPKVMASRCALFNALCNKSIHDNILFGISTDKKFLDTERNKVFLMLKTYYPSCSPSILLSDYKMKIWIKKSIKELTEELISQKL